MLDCLLPVGGKLCFWQPSCRAPEASFENGIAMHPNCRLPLLAVPRFYAGIPNNEILSCILFWIYLDLHYLCP